jgi:hypothetical protein
MPAPLRAPVPNALAAPRVGRIVAVTAGLMGVGAAVGAACGAVAIGIVAVVEDGARVLLRDPELFAVGAAFGAMVGVVAAPLVAWVLLRSVPLGRAIAGTALGTVAGAVAGDLALSIPGAIYGGFAGFAAAALWLHARSRLGGRAEARVSTSATTEQLDH